MIEPGMQTQPFRLSAHLSPSGRSPVGSVADVRFNGALVRLDRHALSALVDHSDPIIAAAGNVGGQLKIRVGDHWLIGSILAIRPDPADTANVIAELDLLGESEIGPGEVIEAFRLGLRVYPRPGDAVMPMSHADLRALFSQGGTDQIEIGHVYPTTNVRAALDIDALLSRHFALLGSTGSGKSNAAALIMHRIIDQAPNGHIVVIDPHGEYAQSFAGRGIVFNVENLALPYWLMNFEEHCEVFVTSEGMERELDKAILARCLARARIKSLAPDAPVNISVDSPVPYMMSEILVALDAEMGKLDNVSELSRYVRLKNRINEVLRDNRYTFMFNRALVADSMKSFLARILRMEDDGKPVAIIDLSGVPTDIVSVVVALVARIVMDHAIWSRVEDHRPVLLVCEEAHRYIPADRVLSGASVRRSLERIAKEGRKYGVSLGLISQRPSDLAEGTLSQCGTIITMRMNNDRDQQCIRNAMPEGGRSFLDALPALRKGECIICGDGVTLPVRVRLDLLPADRRPRSEDPSFSQIWSTAGKSGEALDGTIRRWRHKASLPATAGTSSTEIGVALLKPASTLLSDTAL
ncbi:ATP-binding protein [Polymorphobacter sp.]|uniref:ATP-binding protein n=1 Tax=Polymorphobacter sp. TaxID=1909290 RepID=UPI003F7221A8